MNQDLKALQIWKLAAEILLTLIGHSVILYTSGFLDFVALPSAKQGKYG